MGRGTTSTWSSSARTARGWLPVLGVQAAVDRAGDVMLAATYAIRFGLGVADVADSWARDLPMSEALRVAAGLFRSDKQTSCCA